MKKNIIITGGLGYIGTELCKIYSGESWNNNITVIEIKDRLNIVFMFTVINTLQNYIKNKEWGLILEKLQSTPPIPENEY